MSDVPERVRLLHELVTERARRAAVSMSPDHQSAYRSYVAVITIMEELWPELVPEEER
jgi:hypothetical protein